MARKETMRADLVAADLALAQTITDLGERAVTAIGRNFATSAVCFSSLWTNPEESEGTSTYYNGQVHPGPSPLIQRGIALHAQEVANLVHLFSAPNACLNAESIIGWRQYRQTRCYQKYWHAYGAERQFIMGIGSATFVKGLLVACRPEQARPFSRDEKRQLLQIRDAVSNAMDPFRGTRSTRRSRNPRSPCGEGANRGTGSTRASRATRKWPRDGEGLLNALSASLPIPTIVWDGQGHLVWLNHEAELRWDILTLSHGSTRYYANGKQKLADLWSCARNEIELPGWCLHSGEELMNPWIAPNENLLVRQFPRSGKPPYMILYSVPTTAPENKRTTACPPIPNIAALQPLSPRETEVALHAADGYSVPNTAARLGIAESTIQTHMKHIYRKLTISTRAELILRVYGR